MHAGNHHMPYVIGWLEVIRMHAWVWRSRCNVKYLSWNPLISMYYCYCIRFAYPRPWWCGLDAALFKVSVCWGFGGKPHLSLEHTGDGSGPWSNLWCPSIFSLRNSWFALLSNLTIKRHRVCDFWMSTGFLAWSTPAFSHPHRALQRSVSILPL